MNTAFAVLNPEQHVAATHGTRTSTGIESDPLLIIAGAGTGKTMTLAHRVAWLIKEGVAPERLLLMTFTRRAAREMSQRAIHIATHSMQGSSAASPPINLPWAGTFHSIANRLLRYYAPRIGLDPGFSIIDTTDSADLMDVLRHEQRRTNSKKRFPKKATCQAIYSRCINTQLDLDEVLLRFYPWCSDWAPELRTLFRGYVEAKQHQGILDYDDLLLHWMWLCEHPSLAQHVNDRFEHILVDEYQDTNVLQANILKLLRPQGEQLTVVGDDAQSIYSFRAAEVENILGFPQQFDEPATVVALKQNYRSTQPILDASNALLNDSPVAYRKKLHAQSGSGNRPRLVTVEADQDQAEFVVRSVLSAREEGTALRDQAVLFRSGHHSDRLELELIRRDIPYVKYGGLKFLESAHVKDALSIMRWADNPRNRVAGFRVLKLLAGVGPASAQKALDYLEGRNHQFASLGDYGSIKDDAGRTLAILLASIQDGEQAWPGQVEKVMAWYQPLLELNYQDHFTRLGDLEQLTQIAQHYNNREQFLSELALDPPVSSGDLAGTPHLDDDFLILSTIHSAKGQEWKDVFVLNVADGNFPNEFACGDEKAIEEERRLLYVAMTRAKQSLSLIQPLKYWVPEQPKLGDRHVYGAKSRFLSKGVLETLERAHFSSTESNSIGQHDELAIPIVDLSSKARSLF